MYYCWGAGIAQWYSAGLWAGGGGFESRQGLGIFLFTTVSRPALGLTQTPIQWVPGAPSLGVQQLDREADHSPPSSAKVNNAWSYTSTPHYTCMAWCSVKAQGQLYLYHIRGPFEKFVESPYYSESELCGGAVMVSCLKYLP
jgi:hypothetical protein